MQRIDNRNERFKFADINPDKKILVKLESFHSSYREHMLRLEQGGDPAKVPRIIARDFEHGFSGWKGFSKAYEEWLGATAVEREQHPWKQFLTEKDYKRKDIDPIIQRTLGSEGKTT